MHLHASNCNSSSFLEYSTAAPNQMQSETFLWLYNISKHQDVSRIEQ